MFESYDKTKVQRAEMEELEKEPEPFDPERDIPKESRDFYERALESSTLAGRPLRHAEYWQLAYHFEGLLGKRPEIGWLDWSGIKDALEAFEKERKWEKFLELAFFVSGRKIPEKIEIPDAFRVRTVGAMDMIEKKYRISEIVGTPPVLSEGEKEAGLKEMQIHEGRDWLNYCRMALYLARLGVIQEFELSAQQAEGIKRELESFHRHIEEGDIEAFAYIELAYYFNELSKMPKKRAIAEKQQPLPASRKF